MSRCRVILNISKLVCSRNVSSWEVSGQKLAEGSSPQRKGVSRAKACLGVVAAGLASCAAIAYALESSVVEAAHMSVHPPKMNWGFNGALASLDHSSIRRGWEVYKNVCSGCHSLKHVAFRHLVGVCFSEEEARDIAAEYEVRDGPNEVGEYFMRPGKLQDYIPDPYPNEEAARAANNGALPVDLSFVVNGRHGGPDYVFGLLTGYTEAPAGVELMEGQAFNPYFEGGALGMGEILQDGVVDYEDGTPATKSQLAKDVVEFLMWTSNQDHDVRKLVLFKGILISVILYAFIYPIYRARMAHHKNTKICFIPRPKKKC